VQAVVLVSSSVRQVDCVSQSATCVTETTTVETTPTNRTADTVNYSTATTSRVFTIPIAAKPPLSEI